MNKSIEDQETETLHFVTETIYSNPDFHTTNSDVSSGLWFVLNSNALSISNHVNQQRMEPELIQNYETNFLALAVTMYFFLYCEVSLTYCAKCREGGYFHSNSEDKIY